MKIKSDSEQIADYPKLTGFVELFRRVAIALHIPSYWQFIIDVTEHQEGDGVWMTAMTVDPDPTYYHCKVTVDSILLGDHYSYDLADSWSEQYMNVRELICHELMHVFLSEINDFFERMINLPGIPVIHRQNFLTQYGVLEEQLIQKLVQGMISSLPLA